MSHVVVRELVVNELKALRKAVEPLGMELMEGQKTFRWYGRWVNDYNAERAAVTKGYNPKDFGKCEHAIRLKNDPSAYEIGLVKNPKGPGWVLMYDSWSVYGHAIEKAAGVDLKKIAHNYAVEVCKDQMLKQGYKVSQWVNQKTGRTRITAEML